MALQALAQAPAATLDGAASDGFSTFVATDPALGLGYGFAASPGRVSALVAVLAILATLGAVTSHAIATRVGMPAFLMTLLVVGASNGAAFSPFAPTGIISNGIIAKMAVTISS